MNGQKYSKQTVLFDEENIATSKKVYLGSRHLSVPR